MLTQILRRRSRILLGLTRMGALLLVLRAGDAYGFACIRAGGANNPCIHWTTGGATLRSFLGTPATVPLINGTFTWDRNAQMAADDWNATGVPFQFTLDAGGTFISPCGAAGPGHQCLNTGPDGDNPVFFSGDFCGRGFGDIIELTNNCYFPDDGAMINAPVFVNSNVPWNAYDGPIRTTATGVVLYDIRRVLLHEFGHVLGLAHPDDAGQSVDAIMNSHVSNLDRLQADDINGEASIYGSSGTSPSSSSPPITNGCQVRAAQSVSGSAYVLFVPALLGWLTRRRRSGCSRWR